MTTLTLAEAEGLARAANGRLPDETEMERILGDAPHILSRLPPNIDIWTSSPWSAWSYRLVVPSDHVNVKWLAHPSRILPDVAATSPVCQFRMVSPPARRVAQPDYTGACVMVRDLPPGGGPSR
ncbi:hypothetical protein [Niveispirillum sp.]|uniref:hypothetical protein n=1 Tax=Niveispirillum sp. TaxID=1917217 RepID=UPI001B40A5A2|nr:hypothetical protein [Niveispirillum sp.]MBP7335160.1 hypothetical protein [Niveispirillum sp.]